MLITKFLSYSSDMSGMGIALEKKHWNQAGVHGLPRWGAGAMPRWGTQGGKAPLAENEFEHF